MNEVVRKEFKEMIDEVSYEKLIEIKNTIETKVTLARKNIDQTEKWIVDHLEKINMVEKAMASKPVDPGPRAA